MRVLTATIHSVILNLVGLVSVEEHPATLETCYVAEADSSDWQTLPDWVKIRFL